MRALQHVQIENVLSVQRSQVDGFTRYLPEILKHRAADFSKGRLIADARAQTHQLRSNQIRPRIVAEEVALELKVSEETVRSAFVDSGALRDVFELQSFWRRTQRFEHTENFG